MRNNVLLISLLCIMQLISCQNKKPMPMYYVEICHPSNEYLVTPIHDSIITLEGRRASLPYGSTSGRWGDSGAMFTEQYGTPIGADIVYYARYEDKFYHLKAEFPVEKMKDLVSRAYAISYVRSHKEPLKPYIVTDERMVFSAYENPYSSMTHLVFGFAPKGMVVVWIGYDGGARIEIGRFQAEEVEDEEKYEEERFEYWNMSREKMRNKRYLPNASPEEWENYRNKYEWRPVFSSDDDTFFMLKSSTKYYNGEREYLLQPYILKAEYIKRAIPNEIDLFWRVGGAQYEGRVFFKWDKMDKILKEKGKTKNDIRFHINKDNKIEVFLNDEPLEVESTRVYKSDLNFEI